MMKVIIVGKGGSGKDFLKSKFVSKGCVPCISVTTRPIREGEKDGVDYYFVSEEKFTRLIMNNEFFEYDRFNEWRYGTLKMSFINAGAVMIMTPRGVAQLKEYRKDCLVIYLDIDRATRQTRLLERGDADSVDRRLAADKKDFENFFNFDIRITNPDF